MTQLGPSSRSTWETSRMLGTDSFYGLGTSGLCAPLSRGCRWILASQKPQRSGSSSVNT